MKLSIFNQIKNLGTKRIIGLLILACADVFVIAAPYYLKNIIPNLQTFLHVNESDVANMTAIIGWVTLLTQLPGGWLADKFSSRKMLSLAVLITGLVTFWFGTLALVGGSRESLLWQYYLIFALWGVSSTPLFWTPLWKLVSQQTDKKNQAFAYGLQGAFNGLVGTVFIFIIGTIVTVLSKQYYDNFIVTNPGLQLPQSVFLPFASFVYIIGTLLIVVSFGIWFFVIEKPSTEKFALNIKTLFRVCRDWKVWGLSVFLMGMYMFQSTFAYYMNQMLTNIILVPVLAITILGGVRIYIMRMAISGFVGKYADRYRSLTLLLLITLFIGFIFVSIFLFLPGVATSTQNIFGSYSYGYKMFATVVMVILFLATSFLSWIMVTLRYAQAAEIHRPKNSYGAVTAVLSFIAFSSDAWFYQIAGSVGQQYTIKDQNHTSQQGYQIILAIAIAVAFIGLIAGTLVFISNTKIMKKNNLLFYRWRDLNNA